RSEAHYAARRRSGRYSAPPYRPQVADPSMMKFAANPRCCRARQWRLSPAALRKASDHRFERLIDGVEALADKVGLGGHRPAGGPGEIGVAGAGDVGDVIAMRRHPPQIGIALVRPDLKSVHQALLAQAV